MEDTLLLLDEVAMRLRVSPRSVRRYIKSQGLPAIRLPGRLVVREDDLKTWLDARAREGGTNERTQ